MFKNNQLLWAVLGILVVIIVAVAAYFASVGQTPGQVNGTLKEPVTSADWRLGAAGAKVVLVEYADLECPACAAYAPVVKQLVADYPQDVALIYRHFPLAQHRSSKLSAAFAEAAGRQGKFWEMAEKIFATQSDWTGNSSTENETIFRDFARELGLNMAKLEADLKDVAIATKIDASYQAGSASGVDSTPTFFLNGQLIKNPRTYEDFKILIEGTLASSTAATTTSAN